MLMKRRSLVRSLVVLLILGTLNGCANPNVPQDYKLSSQQPVGLAVGSITFTGGMSLFRVLLQAKTTQKTYFAEVGQSQTVNVFKAFQPPEVNELLGLPGGLFAIQLPAGQYQLTGWRVSQGMASFTPSRREAIDFQIEAGKATYLGNLHFIETSKAFLATTGIEVTLQDKRARDLPALEKQFPTIASNPVAIALAEGTKYEHFGSAGQRRIDVPLFVPMAR